MQSKLFYQSHQNLSYRAVLTTQYMQFCFTSSVFTTPVFITRDNSTETAYMSVPYELAAL